MNKLVLSFNMLADARYFTRERDIRFNLGFMLLFHELAGLFARVESILLNGNKKLLSIRELELLRPPADVQAEVRRFSNAHKGLPVSGRFSQSPIYDTMLRFILCHEFAHLIYFAESQPLKKKWQGIAWSDYDEALKRYIAVYKLDRGIAKRLSRDIALSTSVPKWPWFGCFGEGARERQEMAQNGLRSPSSWFGQMSRKAGILRGSGRRQGQGKECLD